jgi:hypothetical protein
MRTPEQQKNLDLYFDMLHKQMEMEIWNELISYYIKKNIKYIFQIVIPILGIVYIIRLFV